jgi:catechol 2,3-dioxygenase-like lactoylglutathione lyase family enzyme
MLLPTISKTRFVIAVPDLKSSAAFYRDVLGFTIDQVSDPGWLFFSSGDCIIMAAECPEAIPPHKLGDHAYFAYMQINEIDSNLFRTGRMVVRSSSPALMACLPGFRT